jgi:hypothetical protein
MFGNPYLYQYILYMFRNPHLYQYIFNPEERLCGKQPVHLLILVSSALQHRDRRDAIR